MTGLFAKSRIVAPPGFNRWRVPPASIAIHLCIGSVYAWSIFNPPLMRVLGAAAPAADDWTLAQTSRTFVVAIVCLGLAAAVAGKWLERVGPRVVGCVAAVCWGGGFLIGAAGIAWHHLELLYLGYGVLGGIGLGLGYVSPVSTLIRWFPDRRGLAAGMAIMGFGGGAIIAVPVNERLLQHFYRAPQFVGPAESVDLQTVDGRRTALVDGARREVVVVTSAEAAKLPQPSAAGVYVVGTGRTGAVETFCTLGIVYFVVMFGAAMAYRIPAPDWVPVVAHDLLNAHGRCGHDLAHAPGADAAQRPQARPERVHGKPRPCRSRRRCRRQRRSPPPPPSLAPRERASGDLRNAQPTLYCSR